MNYSAVEKSDKIYIKCDSTETLLTKENDALDIIAACMENSTGLVIINDNALSEDFFNLRTGLAGAVLQKFVNYHIKAALIISSKENFNERFREMILEANKGNDFRVFEDIEEAEKWIFTE